MQTAVWKALLIFRKKRKTSYCRNFRISFLKLCPFEATKSYFLIIIWCNVTVRINSIPQPNGLLRRDRKKNPSSRERSALSLGWPLSVAHGSAPSPHKHGSSMASDDGGSSSDRQRVAQQRLKIITGHLQRSEGGDQAIVASECKAQPSKNDVSGEGKTVPRRRYWAGMERRRSLGSSLVSFARFQLTLWPIHMCDGAPLQSPSIGTVSLLLVN